MQAQVRTPCRTFNPIQDPQMGTLFMKHGTAKHSSHDMRFFTPELYRRFNSSDEDEADEASETWEAAITDYKRHLDELGERLPSPARRLAELDLHDAELIDRYEEASPWSFSFGQEPFSLPAAWSFVCILSVRQGNEMISLVYALWDRVQEEPAPSDWPFSCERKHWLYDEVDRVQDDRPLFWHKVLFSDGSIIRIPFVSVIIHAVPLANIKGTM